MTSNIPNEIYQNIFEYIDENDIKTFYSIMLVNRSWCLNIISYLWVNPFKFLNSSEVIPIFLSYLDNERKEYLQIKNELLDIPTSLVFDYPSFIKQVDFTILYDSIEQWISHYILDIRPALDNDYFTNHESSFHFNFQKSPDYYENTIVRYETIAFFEAIFEILMKKCEIKTITMNDTQFEKSHRTNQFFFKTILNTFDAKRCLEKLERFESSDRWFQEEMIATLSKISFDIKSIRVDLTEYHVEKNLVKLIKSQNNLEEFHVKFYRFEFLLNALLSQTHSLKSISISYGRVDIEKSILLLSQFSLLEELRVNETDLFNCIRFDEITLPKLKKLVVIDSYDLPDRSSLFTFICNNGDHLTDLTLFISLLHCTKNFQIIADFCPNLKNFAIRMLKDEDIPSLFNVMNKCQNLKRLYIPQCGFKTDFYEVKDHIDELARNIVSTLILLDLTKWSLSLDILINFFDNLENPPIKFRFTCNCLSKESIQNVIENYASRKNLFIKKLFIEDVDGQWNQFYKCLVEWF